MEKHFSRDPFASKYFALVVVLIATSVGSADPCPAQAAEKAKSKSSPTTFWPTEVDWNKSIPTPKQHFGFEVGFRHLEHAQIVSYMNRLAEVSDRVSIAQYATTHGGRPLLLLTITSPANHQHIKKIQQQSRQLTNPNNAKVDIENLPAIINMGYGVHGDESSATNCAPLVAHYLAAAQGPEIEKLLNDVVVLLDPCLNPDGFNRFANWANRYRGRILNPDPQHAEHNQQWPPGRVNYYWFDLNRDWLPLVHPESQGRMRWYHKWKPNVVLDYHEMGTNSTYFFQPGVPERKNPLTPMENVELTNKFGEYHARALDNRGSLYFTKEGFDDFYMGKGSTYPDLHGAVGILFEQASSRGHVQQNQDGVLKFHDTIANQFATSLSSLKATVDLRQELHEYKQQFYTESQRMGADAKKQTYVFSCPHNRSRLQALASVLLRHDIRCYWLKDELNYGDDTFDPRWTLIVPAKQAEYRFLKSLLMRRTNFRENVFYDVSSWTLPLAYGLNQKAINKAISPEKLTPVKQKRVSQSEITFADDDVAYLIDWRDDGAQRLLAQLLKRDVKVRVARKPFKYGDEEQASFGFGTLQIPLGIQKPRIPFIKSALKNAAKRGVSLTAVKTGLTPGGIDLGSNNFPVVKKPELAMLTGRPVSAYGAGEIWHNLDTRIGLPVTMIKHTLLSRADLDEYTALIFPDGRYAGLTEGEWEKLRQFAQSGGTIVAVGSAAGFVGGQLTGNQELERLPEAELADEPETIQKLFDTAPAERALARISGAIIRADVDLTHPLAYGLTKNHLPVFRNHAQFLKPSSNAFANPLVYNSEKPLLAGYCSAENVERFKGAASVVVYPLGRGRVILMSDNPNFRGFWRGSSRVFNNAIFFGGLTSR